MNQFRCITELLDKALEAGVIAEHEHEAFEDDLCGISTSDELDKLQDLLQNRLNQTNNGERYV